MQAMHEVTQLRGQLTAIATALLPGLDLRAREILPAPNLKQNRLLAQVILSGFLDQVAMRRLGAPRTSSAWLPKRCARLLDL